MTQKLYVNSIPSWFSPRWGSSSAGAYRSRRAAHALEAPERGPGQAQLQITKKELDDWYDWLYITMISDRQPSA